MIGEDGYLRVQQEVAYGTAVATSMTLLPIMDTSLVKGFPERIERNNVIGTRVPQASCAGRQRRNGEFSMEVPPALIGKIINWFLGLSVDVDIADGAYTHTWLIPNSTERIATSYTLQQAIGSSLADQFDGGTITELKFDGDSTGFVTVTATCMFQGLTEDVARITTFSYPSICPFTFGDVVTTITPQGSGTVTHLTNSFSLTINLGYQTDPFYMGTAREITQPIFSGKPTITLNMNVKADSSLLAYARDYQKFDVDVVITHESAEAGTTPTYYAIAFELNGYHLNPETEIPSTNAELNMDLEFICAGGATTTGSGSAVVAGEVRVTDATAAYPAAAS